jgi:hypothetical protein
MTWRPGEVAGCMIVVAAIVVLVAVALLALLALAVVFDPVSDPL